MPATSTSRSGWPGSPPWPMNWWSRWAAGAGGARGAAQAGGRWASHVGRPFGLAGIATLAYELVEQLGAAPGAVILPVGHGTLMLGLHRGFLAMLPAGARPPPPPPLRGA